MPSENLVICGSGGQVAAFDLSGNKKPPIEFKGKAIGIAGYSNDSTVLFIGEGKDLWRGRVNWQTSVVEDANRITDFGAFRADTFAGSWFRHGDVLFVPVFGKTHRVNLSTGQIAPDQADAAQISLGASPDGRMSVASLGIGKFAVVDFDKGEAKQFSLRGHFREFLWLDADPLAYRSDQREISILDTATGTIVAAKAPAPVLKISVASPGGKSVIIGTSQGPMIFSTTEGSFVPVGLPIEDGVWISETAMLCMNSASDSSLRGIWHVSAEGSKERVSNRPADSLREASGRNPLVAVAGGALWVSEGDLWAYN